MTLIASHVCVIELPARWGALEEQLALVDAALAKKPTDLALLPEASLTGYVSPGMNFDLSSFAEPLDGPTAKALASLARTHRTTLVAPLIERDEGRCFNSLVGFDASGARVLHYRKRHPWYPETWAAPGAAPLPVVELAGLKVTCAICFDVHFLAEESRAQLLEADLLLYASAWVDEEGDARTPLLSSLAAQHGLAIANANWGPGSPPVAGQGRSTVFSAEGNVLTTVRGRARRANARIAPRRTS